MPKKKTLSSKHVGSKKQKEQTDTHQFSSKPLPDGIIEYEVAAKQKKKPATSKKTKKFSLKKSAQGSSASSRKKTKAAHTEKIDRELTQIYENADGSLPDMKSFEKKPTGHVIRAVFTLIVSIAFLGGVSWFGYEKFGQPTGTFAEEDVILSIGGDEEASYGEAARYRIRFKNAQSVPLSGATIEVRYPAGFVFVTSSEPTDLDTDNIWTLGALNDGEGAFIDVFGNLYGDVGEAQSFRVFLNYTPSNFSSTFQKVATQETRVTSIPVSISMNGATEVSQGVATSFDITITPDQEPNISLPDNIALVFDPGGPFALQDMEPRSDAFQDLTWIIDELVEEMTYTVTGAFAGSEHMLTAQTYLLGWQEGQTQSDAYIIATDNRDIAVADEQLSIQLVANGSQQDITVQPGEKVHASLVIKNNTQDVFQDVRVRLLFDAPSLNKRSIMYWQGVEDDADGSILGEQLSDTIRRGQITWDAETIRALAALEPNEEVTIDVALPVKTSEQTDLAGYETFEITLASDVQYDITGLKETTAAVPLVLTINSDTTFEVRDEHEDDVHVMTWLLGNSFHPLKDVEAKVDLYGDIAFDPDDAVVPAGDIEYDNDEQQLVWRVTEMPLSIDVLALQFPVTLNKQNPSQSQLTSKVTVTATDAVTGKQVLLIGDEVGL